VFNCRSSWIDLVEFNVKTGSHDDPDGWFLGGGRTTIENNKLYGVSLYSSNTLFYLSICFLSIYVRSLQTLRQRKVTIFPVITFSLNIALWWLMHVCGKRMSMMYL
jgi:hypothetical protein